MKYSGQLAYQNHLNIANMISIQLNSILKSNQASPSIAEQKADEKIADSKHGILSFHFNLELFCWILLARYSPYDGLGIDSERYSETTSLENKPKTLSCNIFSISNPHHKTASK